MTADRDTVQAFSEQWEHFSGFSAVAEETPYMFDEFFSLFPWDKIGLPDKGIDIGSGTGRFSIMVASRVGHLTLLDAAPSAIKLARKRLAGIKNVSFINASVDQSGIDDFSMDFGYSYGVLHHIPDTEGALRDCVRMLKRDAPFLVYLYYKFDNRPLWYAWLWRLSNLIRIPVSRLHGKVRNVACDICAVVIYWPLSRVCWLLDRLGLTVPNFPLWQFRNERMIRFRSQARDRFGTPLENRFTKQEIRRMMERVGLERIDFYNGTPYWCAVGYKT